MRIAVIGAGIAGMAAAWRLSEKHAVTLFEAEPRLGGHAHTQKAHWPGMVQSVPVDTGFIVYNEPTYPNFTAFLQHLGVATEESDMSLGFSIDDGGLEYSGQGLRGLLAQKRNLFNPRYLHMLLEIPRFWRLGLAALEQDATSDEGLVIESLGQWLQRHRFNDYFIRHHLAPMGGAIWSCSLGLMLEFPANAFLAFYRNHGLLRGDQRILWRTVKAGSQEYIKAMQANWPVQLRHNSAVQRVRHDEAGVIVETQSGAELFEQVVLACHTDQSLKLLEKPTPVQSAILSAIPYAQNHAVLHRDPKLMPQCQDAWASWNCMVPKPKDGMQEGAMAVTYWMNRLQNIRADWPLFVTLNPHVMPKTDLILKEMHYAHPQFTKAALKAQRQLRQVQGANGIWFCGAWCGYGFHEDGLASGLAVAAALGCPRPWHVEKEMSPAFENATPIAASASVSLNNHLKAE